MSSVLLKCDILYQNVGARGATGGLKMIFNSSAELLSEQLGLLELFGELKLQHAQISNNYFRKKHELY